MAYKCRRCGHWQYRHQEKPPPVRNYIMDTAGNIFPYEGGEIPRLGPSCMEDGCRCPGLAEYFSPNQIQNDLDELINRHGDSGF